MSGEIGARRTYRLLSEIGRGGFGVVWRGEVRTETGLVQSVAIKVLDPEVSAVAGVVERLRDEARLLSKLRHPAIVRVEDLVNIGDRWAIVLELVEGVDFAEALQGGKVPARALCGVLAQVAEALDHGHRAVDPESGAKLGLVHRDVKPENIRLGENGTVKLLDFGIALARFGGRESETRGGMAGTPGYIAPERYEGEDTPAADVYALGVVLVQAFAGTLTQDVPRTPGARRAWIAGILPNMPEPLRVLAAEATAFEAERRPAAKVVSRRLGEMARQLEGPDARTWATELLGGGRTGEERGDTDGGKPPEGGPTLAPEGEKKGLERGPSEPRILAEEAQDTPEEEVERRPYDGRLLLLLGAGIGTLGMMVVVVACVAWLLPSWADTEDTRTDVAPEEDVSQDGASQEDASQEDAAGGEEGTGDRVVGNTTGIEEAASDDAAERTEPVEGLVPGKVAKIGGIQKGDTTAGGENLPVKAAPPKAPPPVAASGVAEKRYATWVLGSGNDVADVVLVGADGIGHPPGRIELGTYTIVARTAEGKTLSKPKRVEEEGTVTVTCSGKMQNCR